MECTLTAEELDLIFTATDLSSISKIAKPLGVPYDDSFKNLAAPLSKDEGSGKAKGIDSLPASQVRFQIQQKVKTTQDYNLASVFIAIKVDDFKQHWKEWLPESFKMDGIQDTKIRVTVLNPLLKLRRVRTEVSLAIPIGAEKKKNLLVDFVAEPIGYESDFAYRVRTRNQGATTVENVANLAGLDISPVVKANIPLLSDLLSKVGVEHFTAGVERVNGKLSLEDWTITLAVREFSLIPDHFVITNARVMVEKISDKTTISSGSGELYFKSLD